MTDKHSVEPLAFQALSAKPSRRMINKAMADESVKSASFIGQDRARDALEFGLGVNAKGYNLYVMGEPATGRYTLVHEYVERNIRQGQTPDDWCYLNNYEEEREPIALRMVNGESKQLQQDIEELIDDLLDTFPALFDNPSYQRKKSAINREYEQRYDEVIDELEIHAQKQDVALYEEDGTISFSPIVGGKPLEDTEFAKLPDDQRQHFYEVIDDLEELLTERLIELPQWQRANAERLRKLKRETAEQGVKPLLKALDHKYADNLGVLKFVRQMRPHLVDTVLEVLAAEGKEDKHDEYDKRSILEEQYLPNILTHHPLNSGAPVVYEPNPTYHNLFGRIEYSNVQGSVYTNYRMIVPGALHKANGGYLLLDADKMIQQPFVWEALKRALKQGAIQLDISQHDIGMTSTVTLNPQQIALDIKVVLMGSRDLYYTLQDYDDEFDELFRVLVDFDAEIPLNRDNLYDFVGRVRSTIDELQLEDITQRAMYRLVEYSLRLAEHQERLSARFSDVIELLHEAAFFCEKQRELVLDVRHIEAALQAKMRRSGRISQALLDDIKEGQILIDTQGDAVGKINGLTVLEIGDSLFGTPARISCTVYAGANGVVDIEREVELGRAIHSKGVMLLTGFLGHRFAQDFPLTLSANIAIEQSYGHIDGDSASLAELIALLSALSGVPINQSLAVTGSINQYGEVQSIGGVNEKIEGFFRLCQHRGLNGEQGVVIPKSNEINLMLSTEVIEAVKRGKFHIYAVEQVDQAIEVLTGRSAGEPNKQGKYRKGTVNYLAMQRLKDISDLINGGDSEES